MDPTPPISAGKADKLKRTLSYAWKCLPPYSWQRLTRRRHRGNVHVIVCLADHFEPSSLEGNFAGYAPAHVQRERVENWCNEYPKSFREFRDSDGRPFVHTYFYPAEQYERDLVQQIADLCHLGWGELEVHLHHGLTGPDTPEMIRRQLVSFRDALARDHGCLSYVRGDTAPKYAFIHGNFALANCANGFACGVDDEMRILAETGCYVDMTFPTSAFHPAQISKINALYECALPLNQRAPHRRGDDLRAGRAVARFPFIVQGPWALDFDRHARNGIGRVENGALTASNPPSMRRWKLWKNAAIAVAGRPDWLFVKLSTHGMYPGQTEVMLGEITRRFVRELLDGSESRHETLHFVSAREMANIALAACDGREGNPSDYRDYRYRLAKEISEPVPSRMEPTMVGTK